MEMGSGHMAQAQGIVGGLAGAQAAGRQAQVIGEIGYLQNGVSNLGSVIEGLEKRLVGVLRCEPPQPTNETKNAVSEVMVPLADQIRASRQDVNRLAEILASIVRRLEI